MLYDLVISHQLKWNLPLLFFFLIISVSYVIFINKYAIKMHKTKRPYMFLMGLFLLYSITATPLASLSHLLLSAHMLQLSILSFVIPPLLLFGSPIGLLKKISIKIYPVTCLVLFSLFLYIYHLPLILTFLTANPFIHVLYSWGLFLLAIVMWIPIILKDDYSFEKYGGYAYLSIWFISPACLLLLILPSDGGSTLFTNLGSLCIPKEYINEWLAPPINLKFDQSMAGMVMFLVHKAGMSVVTKLELNLNEN